MSKKLLHIYLALSFLSICFFLLPNKAPVYSVLANNKVSGEYIFYAKNIGNLDDENATIIKNGNSYIVKTTFENAKNIKSKLNNVFGEAVRFDGNTIDAISAMNKIGIDLKVSESVNNIQIFYGFVKGLEKYMFIGHEKINTEIAISHGKITIGYPIILGDY